jgi:PPM family protein phosphatase
MKFEASSVQLQGARDEQEDRVIGRFVEGGALVALVADGLGGHANGGQAAETGITAVANSLDSALNKPMQSLRMGLVRAFIDGHRAVARYVRGRGLSRPGTTMVGGVFVPQTGQACIGSVGDSPSWLVRGGAMTRITRRLDITYALGIYIGREGSRDEGDDIEVVELDLQPGDMLLLASDGIDDYRESEIKACLDLSSAQATAESIAMLVLLRQVPGRDNTSVIVLRVYS